MFASHNSYTRSSSKREVKIFIENPGLLRVKPYPMVEAAKSGDRNFLDEILSQFPNAGAKDPYKYGLALYHYLGGDGEYSIQWDLDKNIDWDLVKKFIKSKPDIYISSFNALIRYKKLGELRLMIPQISTESLLIKQKLYLGNGIKSFLTPLQYAIKCDFIDGAFEITEQFPKLNDYIGLGDFGLYLCKKYDKNTPNFQDQIKNLTERGANLKTVSGEITLLHYAIIQDLPELVELMIPNSDLFHVITLKSTGPVPLTPLQLAIQKGRDTCINKFLEAKIKGISLLEHLLDLSNNIVTDDILFLIKMTVDQAVKSNAEIKASEGQNSLIINLLSTSPLPKLNREAVNYLFNKEKANVDDVNSAFKILLDRNSDLNIRDLHYLQTKGANITQVDNEGNNVLRKVVYQDKPLTKEQLQFLEKMVVRDSTIFYDSKNESILDSYLKKPVIQKNTALFLFKLRAMVFFQSCLKNEGQQYQSDVLDKEYNQIQNKLKRDCFQDFRKAAFEGLYLAVDSYYKTNKNTGNCECIHKLLDNAAERDELFKKHGALGSFVSATFKAARPSTGVQKNIRELKELYQESDKHKYIL